MFSSDPKHIYECKTSKKAWDYLEWKYRDEFYSVMEDKSLSFEVNISVCSTLMASHSKMVSKRSTY